MHILCCAASVRFETSVHEVDEFGTNILISPSMKYFITPLDIMAGAQVRHDIAHYQIFINTLYKRNLNTYWGSVYQNAYTLWHNASS